MSRGPVDVLITRIKIANSAVHGRTLVQYQGLDEDERDQVELLLPPGYVARPVQGADAVELQIGAYASHKVALGGDATADALADIQPGEFGLSNGGRGQQIVLRITGLELIGALLQWGPTRSAVKRLVQEEFVALFNSHTHGGGAPPDQQMSATHLTGGS